MKRPCPGMFVCYQRSVLVLWILTFIQRCPSCLYGVLWHYHANVQAYVLSRWFCCSHSSCCLKCLRQTISVDRSELQYPQSKPFSPVPVPSHGPEPQSYQHRPGGGDRGQLPGVGTGSDARGGVGDLTEHGAPDGPRDDVREWGNGIWIKAL